MSQHSETSECGITENEYLKKIFKKINNVIANKFHEKDFGILVIDAKKIKIYKANLEMFKCIFSISHKANFFEIGNTLKAMGLQECFDSTIPEKFQKDYFDNEIWLFEIHSKTTL